MSGLTDLTSATGAGGTQESRQEDQLRRSQHGLLISTSAAILPVTVGLGGGTGAVALLLAGGGPVQVAIGGAVTALTGLIAVGLTSRSSQTAPPEHVPAGKSSSSVEEHSDVGDTARADSRRPQDSNAAAPMLATMARRTQRLVAKAIRRVEELEHKTEDPEQLDLIFEIDHLTTQMRRLAENFAVLTGQTPQRQAGAPLPIYTVLRAATSEVDQYSRIEIVPPDAALTLRGDVVAEVIHLLAELLENATRFSPGGEHVEVRTRQVARGLAVEIEDSGLGIPDEERDRLNDLLATTEYVNADERLADGRTGVAVVKVLAQHHSVDVQLKSNIYGGTDAVVVLPKRFIGNLAEQETSQKETVSRAAQDYGLPQRAADEAPAHNGSHRVEAAGRPHDDSALLPSRSPGAAGTPPRPPNPDVRISGDLGSGLPLLPQRTGSHLPPEMQKPPAANSSTDGPDPDFLRRMGDFVHYARNSAEDSDGPPIESEGMNP